MQVSKKAAPRDRAVPARAVVDDALIVVAGVLREPFGPKVGNEVLLDNVVVLEVAEDARGWAAQRARRLKGDPGSLGGPGPTLPPGLRSARRGWRWQWGALEAIEEHGLKE